MAYRPDRGMHPMFRPRHADGSLMDAIPIYREVVCYTIPGFVLHKHVILDDAYTVSHRETGLRIADGNTPVLALRAVRHALWRERRQRGASSCMDVLQAGIERGRKRAAFMDRVAKYRY